MRLEWDINRGRPQTPESEFVKRVFAEGLDIYEIMEQMLEAPYFGYVPMEILWRYEGGFLVPKAIQEKPRQWFHFDSNNLLRFKSKGNPQGQLVEQYKFLVIQNKPTYTNPYGKKLLSKCFWNVYYKRNAIKFWARFAEKFGFPYLVGKLPPAFFEEKYDEMLDLLDDMIQDGTIVVPEGTTVDILEASKTSSADIFLRLADFNNAEISKALLSHTGSTDSTPGRLGNDNTALEVRADIIESDARRFVCKPFNQLIRRIINFNFQNPKDYPVFSMYEEGVIDTNRANRDKTLADTQQFRFTKKYWTAHYGFKDDEIEMIEEPAPAPFAEPDPAAVKVDGQAVVDTARQSMVESSERADAMAAMVAPVLKLIQEGSSYEELLKKIPEMYGELDTSKVEALIERAVYGAEATGYISAAGEQ